MTSVLTTTEAGPAGPVPVSPTENGSGRSRLGRPAGLGLGDSRVHTPEELSKVQVSFKVSFAESKPPKRTTWPMSGA